MREPVETARAVEHLARQERAALGSAYGTRAEFRNGRACTNLDHALDVAAAAVAGAHLHVASGDLPRDAPYAALLAALYHVDARAEGPDDELRDELAQRGCFDDEFMSLVLRGVAATRVRPREKHVFAAVMFDATHCALHSPACLHVSLGRYVEKRGAPLTLGPATLYDIEPHPVDAIAWLRGEARAWRDHVWALPYNTTRHYTMVRANAAELERHCDLWERGDTSWNALVNLARPLDPRVDGQDTPMSMEALGLRPLAPSRPRGC